MAPKSLLEKFPVSANFNDRLQEQLLPWWLRYLGAILLLLLIVGFLFDVAAGPVQQSSQEYGPLIISSRLTYAYALAVAVFAVLLISLNTAYETLRDTD